MQYVAPDNFDVIQKVLKTYNLLKLQRGVEVGVRHGFFSEYLLKNNPQLEMILVDPYTPYVDLNYIFTKDEQDEIKHTAANRLERFDYRAKWSYLESIKAAACFDDEFFDFVFIDGEHTYEHVKQDMSVWWGKVRLGGLLAGHDFSMQGVSSAVKDWMFEHKIKELFTSPSDAGDCFWLVRV